MGRSSVLLSCTSLAAGLLLVILLSAYSGLSLRKAMTQLGDVVSLAFVRLSLLMALYVFLSAEKWRLIDRHMRGTAEALPRLTGFALTAAGMALGQVLPVQVSVSVARTLGTWVHGRALRRGTVGTLLEQAFDFLVVCVLALATVATRAFRGGAAMWLAFAAIVSLVSLAAVAPVCRLVQAVAARILARRQDRGPSRWRAFLHEVHSSGILEAQLGRRLTGLSLLRFAVLVLIAGQVTSAIHANIPLWHFAAAMPVVVIAMALSITPAGLGVTEVAYAGMLGLFGTSLPAATQWAIANRLLSCVATLLVAVVATLAFLVVRVRGREEAGAAQASAGTS